MPVRSCSIIMSYVASFKSAQKFTSYTAFSIGRNALFVADDSIKNFEVFQKNVAAFRAVVVPTGYLQGFPYPQKWGKSDPSSFPPFVIIFLIY